MAQETIFQHWVVTEFILPFLLVFVVVFAILQKSKVLGSERKQLDAIVAFVMALIFVSFLNPKDIVNNMILFLTIAIVLVFVALVLWGFVVGGEAKITDTKIKWVAGIVIVAAVLIAFLWAAGIGGSSFDLFFNQSWSGTFWTNVFFIVVIAIVLAVVIRSGGGGKS